MKKVKIFSIIALALSTTGCLKDKPNVDFSNSGVFAEISSGSLSYTNAPISGLDYFKSATLPSFVKDTTCKCFLPDTVTFNVNIAGEYPPKTDVTVTLGLDDAKRVASNSYYKSLDTNATQYKTPPDSIYTLVTKTVLVKAGSRLAKAMIIFYPDKIDPSTSYLFPISITNTSVTGIVISGNLGTVYFHNLGNPLAGPYTVKGTRTNYNGASSAGSIASVVDLSLAYSPKIAAPESTTVVDISYANLSSSYIITANPTATAITDLKVNITGVTNFGIDLLTFDPATRTIHIISHYTNGAGDDRIIDETFTHQ